MQNKTVQFIDWGSLDYKEAWDRQEELLQKPLLLSTAIA